VPDPPPPPPPPEPGTEPPGRARGRVHHPTEELSHDPEPPSEELAPPSAEPLAPESAAAGEVAAPETEFDEPQGPPSSAPLEPAGASAGSEDSGPQLFDFESEETGLADGLDEPAAPVDSDDFAELGPPEEEAPSGHAGGEASEVDEVEEGPLHEPPSEEYDEPAEGSYEELPAEPEDSADVGVAAVDEDEEDAPPPAPATDEEDLLAESPDFMEGGGGDTDEDLWFEKNPPQDFDFDDEE
jgi:hypothetical protein